jgi:hypothetical protein
MDFEAYLSSKKIDSAAFRKNEPSLWESWRDEFEQMHPDSFTMQKLNLINPIRRKYTLIVAVKQVDVDPKQETTEKPAEPMPLKPKPAIPKPVFKPKPKL